MDYRPILKDQFGDIDNSSRFNHFYYDKCDPVLKYKLMIKTHFETGMNYLCITSKNNYLSYKGSGTKWRKLLKERESKIYTFLLYTTDSLTDLSIASSYFSILFDLPNNENFANSIAELGYTGQSENFKLWTKEKTSDQYIDWRNKISDRMVSRHKSMSDKEKSNFCESISNGRNNMTDEAKEIRARRVSDSFASSYKRKSFVENMKTDRLGIKNPMSKTHIWFGEYITKGSFLKLLMKLNLTYEEAIDISKTRSDCVFPKIEEIAYENISCLYCDKQSGGKRQVAFKRWHNENCKHKPK